MRDISTFQLVRELLLRLDGFLYDGAPDAMLEDMDTEKTQTMFFTVEEYEMMYKELIRRKAQAYDE